ncbi:MAG: tetratricopeptide repeat protein [Deltaproteobacteria bacterium]|nr:tetratricopeptide repeat protein [Deltaproteobacteria bacterium]MDQ3295370.1 tetratricopeptide repeat protein [Myxococcota bacterium]
MRRLAIAISFGCGLAGTALAQPAPAPATDADRESAKALLQSGLKLYAAKDYLGALAVFRDAYGRFPSSKILLNIGTTLIKLDRHAEAANVYQRYLDAADSDPTKRADALKALAELDRKVGVVDLAATPVDAEVQVGDGDWQPATTTKRVRVTPGEHVVRFRHPDHHPLERRVTLVAGASEALTVTLEARVVVEAPVVLPPDDSLRTRFEPDPRSRFGALALAHLDPVNQGGAALVGVAVDVTGGFGVRGAAILGPYFGGYAGATFAFLSGRVRPIVAAGIPVFSSNGMRVALRGAGGVELSLGRHLALIAELGVEYLVNPEASVESATLFVPAIGAAGRL